MVSSMLCICCMFVYVSKSFTMSWCEYTPLLHSKRLSELQIREFNLKKITKYECVIPNNRLRVTWWWKSLIPALHLQFRCNIQMHGSTHRSLHRAVTVTPQSTIQIWWTICFLLLFPNISTESLNVMSTKQKKKTTRCQQCPLFKPARRC